MALKTVLNKDTGVVVSLAEDFVDNYLLVHQADTFEVVEEETPKATPKKASKKGDK